jgi:hypothetical protein
VNLYHLARLMNTADAITTPRRLPRRLKNILLGRLLSRAGVFRILWGGR